MKVISYYKGGNSFPIVIQWENKMFLVKLRAGLSGEYSLLSEWLGNHVGKLIGLNTRLPQWILLTDSIKYDNTYVEVRDLIEKSMGINIGFEYFEQVGVLDKGEISKIDKDKQIDIYLLDVLLLNIDRTAQNCNLLITKSGLLVTDYDSCLIFNDFFKNSNLSMNKQILQCLRSNPFYQNINDYQLTTFLNKINEIDFERIIYDIPDALFSQPNKELICKKIAEKKSIDWNLRGILENLENTKLETEGERYIRTNKNREKIEKLLSSKLKKIDCPAD